MYEAYATMHFESPKDTLTLVVISVLAKDVALCPLSRLTCRPLTGSPLQSVLAALYVAIHGVRVRAWTGSFGRARAPALSMVVKTRTRESCMLDSVNGGNVCKIVFAALYFWVLACRKVLIE